VNTERAYRILELPSGSGLDQVKAAFRRLAKSHHPDLTRNPHSGERFTQIAEAYTFLESRFRSKSGSRIPPAAAPAPMARRSRDRAPAPKEMAVEQVYSLGQILVSSTLADLRVFAAQNLGGSGRMMAYAFLKHGMYDSERRVVLASIRSVGRLRAHQSAADLAHRYETGDREIQLAVLAAVDQIGSTGPFAAVLRSAVRSPHPSVREMASRMV
jgi:hypothetical protein